MLHFLSALRSPSLSIPVLLCLELLPVRNVFCQHVGPLPTWGHFTFDFQFGDFRVTQAVGILVANCAPAGLWFKDFPISPQSPEAARGRSDQTSWALPGCPPTDASYRPGWATKLRQMSSDEHSSRPPQPCAILPLVYIVCLPLPSALPSFKKIIFLKF